ncbi:MAG: superinfection immunity protein [Deltaproteobacteria bacterium]|jgi:hypothetical protein|nr:superinfection immunity protein [Deltaproteobacteria bacterium]
MSLAIYFIPSYIAYSRKHNNFLPILLINFFLGWTVLAWIAALLWALTNDTK